MNTQRRTTWLALAFLAWTFVLVIGITRANAVSPVTRSGLDYNGVRNPGGCAIENDGGELHLSCLAKRDGATGPAFVRYRFTKKQGYAFVRDNAVVSADIHNWVGTCQVKWMSAYKQAARTLRIEAPLGTYCHVVTISAMQAQQR